MLETVLRRNPNKPPEEGGDKASLIKLLREKKRISRMELSRITRLSTYQVEGLEGKGTQNLLDRIFLCVKALGYQTQDIFHLIESTGKSHPKLIKGALAKPYSETTFNGNVKLMTYYQKEGSFFGLLVLGGGKSFKIENLPVGDIIFGLVREGTLVMDIMLEPTVHKKDNFFVLPGSLSVELANADNYSPTSILIFSFKHLR